MTRIIELDKIKTLLTDADLAQLKDIIELGQIIETCRGKGEASQASARASEDQITVVDLTGAAVQDIQVATAV